MITPLRITSVICGLFFIFTAKAQFATSDPYAKQIDAYVEQVSKIKFTDSLVIPATHPQVAGMSPPGNVVAYYHAGQLKAIVSTFIDPEKLKFEVSYFFRNDSLLYLNMEYAEAAEYIGAGFYIVQYRKAHYFRNATSMYWNNEGSAMKVPQSYKREPADLKQYADTYLSVLKTQK